MEEAIADTARTYFLLRSRNIPELNARIIYAELMRIPDKDDIREFCQKEMLLKWMPSEDGTHFIRCSPGKCYQYLIKILPLTCSISYVDAHDRYGPGPYLVQDVVDEYLENIRSVTASMKKFREGGLEIMSDMTKSGMKDEEKIRLMHTWREMLGVPTKEPAECGENQVIICMYLPGAGDLPLPEHMETLRRAMVEAHESE
ncbi:hypothetical protein NLJ89_g11158 [Agrocybe chaxingu]|uniref:Uncharacterized protein n=1 Tax=Agrocybe chaxingu TaxID=84603 RepID=A0A9W8MN97_9AGAR|nr:hypothetical protein NLJ89_g11158 [Agrocybe chaxingu]